MIPAWAGDPEVRRFRCSGCGHEDDTVWDKDGVEHWRRGDMAKGEPFEFVCGRSMRIAHLKKGRMVRPPQEDIDRARSEALQKMERLAAEGVSPETSAEMRWIGIFLATTNPGIEPETGTST